MSVSPQSAEHYALVVAVLKGMEVQARVVSGMGWIGVEVRREQSRIVWANSMSSGEDDEPYPVPWGWTEINLVSGDTKFGRSHIAHDAAPEDVALMIMTAYGVPDEAPAL